MEDVKMKMIDVLRAAAVVAAVMWAMGLSAQGIEALVRQQVEKYPQCRLLDLYKSCFQDYMGAEHLVVDRGRMRAYLDEELASTSADELLPWHYEPCGVDGRHVRVSLRAIHEGLLTQEALLDAFVKSANAVKRPSLKSWKKRWRKILRAIDKMRLDLKDYEQDRELIEGVLASGEYAISHSPDYRDAYHPHYRIVERTIFEREIKPLLER
jgi:hypothetical protein